MSPRSIKHAKIALGLIFACALEDGAVASYPIQQTRYIPSPEAQRAHAKPEAKRLTATDVLAILKAMPETWRAFFSLLAHSGVRVGELLGLTWANVHLGDDPHLSIVEQVYRGERKGPKWGSVGKVPLSPGMAAWLSELRSEDVGPHVPVFPSKTGTPLTYANVYNRVLRPALVKAGIAVHVGEVEVRRRDGTVEQEPVWDYQRVAFHAFRHACGSLLVAHGKQDVQVQGWLRHAKLSTTHDVYLALGGRRVGRGGDCGRDSGGQGPPWGHRTPGDSRKRHARRSRRNPFRAGNYRAAADSRRLWRKLIIGRSLVRVPGPCGISAIRHSPLLRHPPHRGRETRDYPPAIDYISGDGLDTGATRCPRTPQPPTR